MLSPYQRAAISLATGFSLFSVAPRWPAGHTEKIPAPATIAETFAGAGKAVPFQFTGHHAPDLRHLSAQRTVKNAAANAYGEYTYEFKNLQAACPSLQKQSVSNFDAPNWFMQSIAGQDVRQMPRRFLEAAYHTVGRSPNSPVKTQALTALQQGLAEAPEYLAYLEEKRALLDVKLAADPMLQFTDAAWVALPAAKKELVLDRIARLTLETLLPDNEIAFPRVVYAMSGYPSGKDHGRYHQEYNDVYMDGKSPLTHSRFQFAKQVAIHESFHAFVSMVAQWYNSGKLAANPDLNRQGKIYALNTLDGGTLISFTDSTEGYLTNPNERGAWAFQLAADHGRDTKIGQDMFTFRYDNGQHMMAVPAPVYRRDASEGQLPSACGLK